MKQRVIVVDGNTFGIMCESVSYSVAHSVSLGFINASVRILPANLSWLESKYNKNYNDKLTHYQFFRGDVFNMSPSLITDEWLSLRNLAFLRNRFQMIWETRCNQYLLNRSYEYAHLDKLDGYLWRELEKCNPDTNFYTQAIIEWATLSGIDPTSAYQELKLKADSRGLQYLRNHAIHQRFVNLINQETTVEKLQEVLIEGVKQLINKAEI